MKEPEGDSDFHPAEEVIDGDTNDGQVDFIKPSDA